MCECARLELPDWFELGVAAFAASDSDESDARRFRHARSRYQRRLLRARDHRTERATFRLAVAERMWQRTANDSCSVALQCRQRMYVLSHLGYAHCSSVAGRAFGDAPVSNSRGAQMKRLLLIDPDDGSRGAIAARLRNEGHDVLETDEQNALLLYREGVDAVFVLSAADSTRAAALLDELTRAGQPPVVFFAKSLNDAVSCAPSTPWLELVGETTAMRDLRATVRRLSRRPRTHVLVGGEPGTGKHAFAHVLHRTTRPLREFVIATPERLPALLDVRFAELALRGGTLYLPNVAGIPKHEQRRVVAWLAEHEGSGAPPVRLVVGATLGAGHVPLDCVRPDLLLPELALRIPVTIELLPLRKRTDDVTLLVRHFLRAWSQASKLAEPEITPAAIEALAVHSWPGNLRELANVLECAAVTAAGTIDAPQLPALGPRESRIDYELPRDGIDFCEFERAVLSQALRRAGGNQTRAASLLGLTRDQIRYRMGKFGLARSSSTSAP